MFDIGWSEIVVIGVVALIVIGPKELPGVLRAIGQWTTKIKRMAGEFQSQFQEAMREAEMADLKKEVDAATKGMTSHFDPLDVDEATRWEPSKESNTESKSDSKTEPTVGGTPVAVAADAAPAATSSAAQGGVAPAEPAVADAPEPSPDRVPAAASDVGSMSAPHPAVPLADGSGRA
jgi:sec-independent protein translocase protein TatB